MSRSQRFLAQWKVWLPVLVTLLAGVGVYVQVSDDNGDNRPDTIVIRVGETKDPTPPLKAPDGVTEPERTIGDPSEPVAKTITADTDQEAEPSQVAESGAPVPAQEGPDIHEDAKDETPGGKVYPNPQDIPTVGVGEPKPLGGAQAYSCPNRYVVNHSKRVGTIRGFVLHYTVSDPFRSFNAIWGLFNTRAFAASSDFLWEPKTSRCARLVPPGEKAWTQGNMNNSFESVEITARGTESKSFWMETVVKPGKLAHLVADRLKANGLQPRFMDPIGCGVQFSGWTDHAHLECGNTHHDVLPTFPYAEFAAQVKRAYYGAAATTRKRNLESSYDLKVLTRGERRAATCLLAERRIADRRGGWKEVGPGHRKRAERCKATLGARLAALHKLGLSSTANRVQRHRVLHEVV